MNNADMRKVTIVGAGKVGVTAAYALLLSGEVGEIMLFGRSRSKLVGEKLDLEHARALASETTISISNNYANLKGTDVFVFCAGAAQALGKTRCR